MSRGKKLLILLLVLVIAAAGVILVMRFAGKDDADSNIELSVLDSSEIRSVSWVYDGDTFKLLPDDDDNWYIDGQKDLDLDPTVVNSMISLMSNFHAQKEVAKSITDEKKYGFDKSELTVTVKTDNAEKSFTLGDFNETAGYYYLKSSGSDSLWYVDAQLRSLFCVDAFDLVKRETIPIIDKSDVGYINIKTDGKECTVKNVGNSDDAEFVIDTNDADLDQAVIENLISMFINIPWEGVEAVNVGSGDLSEYGLDKPNISVSMTYTYQKEDPETETGGDDVSAAKQITETSELLIGSQAVKSHTDDEQFVYAMLAGGKNVYTINQSTADVFMLELPDALYDMSVIRVDTSNLTSLSVKYKGSTYDIVAETESTYSEAGKEQLDIVYKLNGTEINLDEFINQLSSFKAKSIENAEIKNTGNELISVAMTDLNNASQTVAVYELASDPNSCAVSVDGSIRRTADYIDCDNIADAFRDALAAIESA